MNFFADFSLGIILLAADESGRTRGKGRLAQADRGGDVTSGNARLRL